MGFVQNVRKAVKSMGKAVSGNVAVWDMGDKDARQRQVKRDFEYAKTEKTPYTAKMVEMDNYYNNRPYTHNQALELKEKLGIKSNVPVLTDPFIQCESQIDDVVPAFEFRGRDDDLDNRRAKIREQVVDFILYNNNIGELNLDNERSLNALGNAFWKVAFDGSIRGPNFVGDIVIGNPDPANIFPDPNAYDIDDCEFIIYAYRCHRRKARRMFGKAIDDIMSDNEHGDTEIYENGNQRSVDDETLQVLEYWYRDDDGDIACSIQVNNVEVKHIPKYWKNTMASGNQMYPIIKYGKIPARKCFWDKGEIETIKDLCDAANREFITAILNDMFMANDITVVEKDALAEGQETVPNTPGATVWMKPNRAAGIRRMGGVSENGGILNMINFIHEKIQETAGNYESAMGKEPTRVTTASGIAQLNEKADRRTSLKKAGRTEGFKRLAQLLDWTALEFYNSDRLIMIRGKKEGEPDTSEVFNSDDIRMLDQQKTIEAMNQSESAEPVYYYPKVDVEVNIGEGIKKSKAFTLAATQELAAIQVTPQNIGIVLAIVDLLDLPNKDDIRESMTNAVAMQKQQEMEANAPQQPRQANPEEIIAQLPPEQQQAFMQLPPDQQQAFLQQAMGGAA